MASLANHQKALELLRHSKHAVALTGAGVSTPSGIPDFRSPSDGVWEKVDAMEVASLFAFRRNPAAFFQWIRPMVHLAEAASPNPAHHALARMEQMGRLELVITQNIDGLHGRAGSRQVVEIHGNFRTATCIGCYRAAPGAEVLAFLMEREDGVPTCRFCGGILKPDVILFGEQLPAAALQLAFQAARCCDLMLVAGSSLTVEPAMSLPEIATRHGAKLILINLQPTPLDELADAVIRQDVAVVLPELAEGLARAA